MYLDHFIIIVKYQYWYQKVKNPISAGCSFNKADFVDLVQPELKLS